MQMERCANAWEKGKTRILGNGRLRLRSRLGSVLETLVEEGVVCIPAQPPPSQGAPEIGRSWLEDLGEAERAEFLRLAPTPMSECGGGSDWGQMFQLWGPVRPESRKHTCFAQWGVLPPIWKPPHPATLGMTLEHSSRNKL